jgi:hypothetical protein
MMPNTVDSRLVAIATRKLNIVAESQSCRLKKFSYQRSEKLGGGNCRKSAELKDMGMMTRMGASKKANTRMQNR